MSDLFSPADASAPRRPADGGRTTKVHGQIVHVAPGNAMLLSVQAVAEMLGCSTRHVYRLSDAGRMPRPLKLGALVRWNLGDLNAWIAAGCPVCRKGIGR